MLAALDVDYVIVGHSERRQLFGEDDDDGEPEGEGRLPQRDGADRVRGGDPRGARGGRDRAKVAEQVRRGVRRGRRGGRGRAVVAYEPIWAIGTGRTAEPTDAGQVVEVIRATLADRLSAEVAAAVRVQYGGSVKPGNIREFMAHPEIDGALVGGASLDPEGFALIVRYR